MSDEHNVPPDDESTRPAPSRLSEPSWIGPYKILQKIGEGGMGVVYLAEQREPIRRRVALKVIKLGMDTPQVIARFESERQALAVMNHPNVAKVFDAGATDHGRPYFVMEYVKGVPITEHCDRQRLTTEERLKLFIKVCEGVQHAHQKGIIHRDLKPRNVLVAIDGGIAVPKVIDFGLAKATEHRLTERSVYTELGQIIGTPEYMSPEQAEMTTQDIDTRTDVYSLGVVLYELLAGALPFNVEELRRAGFDEIRRRIREEEPPRPSTRVSSAGNASMEAARNRRSDPPKLVRSLRGELDWITMKALEKDRLRRYATVSELAEDVGRHLGDLPIAAGRPSSFHRFKKSVKRNRLLAAAILGTTSALSLGLAGTTLMFLEARRSELKARNYARSLQREHYSTQVTLAAQALEMERTRVAERALKQADRTLRDWEWHYLHQWLDSSDATFYGFFPSFSGRGAKLKLVDREGQEITVDSESLLVEQVEASPLQVKRSETLVAASRSKRFRVVSTHGNEIRFLGSGESPLEWPINSRLIDVRTQFSLPLGRAYISASATTPVSMPSWEFSAGERWLGLCPAEPTVVGQCTVFDTSSGEAIKIGKGADEAGITAIEISERGPSVYLTRVSGGIERWDFGAEAVLEERWTEDAMPTTIKVLWPGPLILIGFANGRVAIERPGGEKLFDRALHEDEVIDVELCKANGVLYSTSRDNTVRVTELDSGETVSSFLIDDTPIVMDVDCEERLLALGQRGAVVRVWTDGNGGKWRVLNVGESVSDAAFSKDNRFVGFALLSGGYRVYDVQRGVLVAAGRGASRKVHTLHSSRDGRGLLVDGGRPTFAISFIPESTDLLLGGAWPPLGVRSLERNGELVRLWRRDDSGRLQGHREDVTAIAVSPDGKWGITGSRDEAFVWQLQDRKFLKELEGHAGPVLATTFSANGEFAATGDRAGVVQVWSVPGFARISTMKATGGVLRLAFSPDGKMLAGGLEAAQIRDARAGIMVWGTEEAKVITRLEPPLAGVTGLTFSKDGHRLVSGDRGGFLRFWDTEAWANVVTLQGKPIDDVLFSPDGGLLVSVERGGRVVVRSSRFHYESERVMTGAEVMRGDVE